MEMNNYDGEAAGRRETKGAKKKERNGSNQQPGLRRGGDEKEPNQGGGRESASPISESNFESVFVLSNHPNESKRVSNHPREASQQSHKGSESAITLESLAAG